MIFRILQLWWMFNLLFLCSLEFSPRQKVSPFCPNCVLFIEHKVWPNFGENSEPKTLGKQRRNSWGALADRSDKSHNRSALTLSRASLGSRSIGSHATIDRRSCCATRIVGPIDRLVLRDRSASFLPFRFCSLKFLPIEWLIYHERSAMGLYFSSSFSLLQNVLFCILFHLDFCTCA